MAHASWGPGWPHCQYSKINHNFFVDTKWGRVTFPGGIRHEAEELISRLVKETANRGYRFGREGNPSYGCWGFSCRAIAGTSTASNHSWGLAVDINAPSNPRSTKLKTNMPSWMPDLWNAYGFRWGGDYKTKPDAMHYEFMGSVADMVRLTQVARSHRLGEIRTLAPPRPVVPAFPGTVKMGDSGEAVKIWQRQLIRQHYGIVADGEFGPRTNHVLIDFQRKHGLVDDGIAGPATWHWIIRG